MNRITAIVFLFLRFHCSIAQANDSNVMEWSAGYKLTYEDFKGMPGNGSEVALTSSGFYFLYDYDGNKHLKVEIKAMFDKSKSWFREDGKNEQVLLHEQTHFDITELYVRQFRKFLVEKQFTSGMKFNLLLPRYYNEFINKCSTAQNHYDIETSHGTRDAQQKEWEKKITRQLKQLEEYNSGTLNLIVR